MPGSHATRSGVVVDPLVVRVFISFIGGKMSDKYILKDHEAVPCDDLMEWAKWFEKGNRRVAEDVRGDIRVSTIFLGMNHNWGDGPPLLFETMIFGGEHDLYQDRYATWNEAVDGHKKACALAFGTAY